MATNDLIQRLPMVGGPALDVAAESHRRKEETFIAGGTITAGDVVQWDTGKTGAERAYTVIQSTGTATGHALACGVALESAVANGRVKVVVSGYVALANAGTVAGAGALLGAIGAGEVSTMPVQANGAVAQTVFGVSLGAKVGNFCPMIVYPQF